MVSRLRQYHLQMLNSPRDQELRFTVHDSADYYQLKVSVFNDDKKTELIGESWVALDKIVIPGGGQSDVWHNLNCKGRYAGEIRIELTYYDTRPREGRPDDQQKIAPMPSTPEGGRESVGGPRQPKPVKRRPLPADPTSTTPPAQVSHVPPHTLHQQQSVTPQSRYVESPDDYQFYTQPQETYAVSDQDRFEQEPGGLHHPQPFRNGQELPSSQEIPSQMYKPRTHNTRTQPRETFMDSDIDLSLPQLHNGCRSTSEPPFDTEPEFGVARHPSEHYGDSSYSLDPPVHGAYQMSAPPVARPVLDHTQSQPALSSIVGSHQRSTFANSGQRSLASSQRQSLQNIHPNLSSGGQDHNEAPPPPPTHRTSTSREDSLTFDHLDQQAPTHLHRPAPLHARNARTNISGSPLSQIQNVHSQPEHRPTATPLHTNSYSQPIATRSTPNASSPLRQRRSPSPIRDIPQATPPSLIAGYEPSVADDESERLWREQIPLRQSAQQHSLPQQRRFMPTSQSSNGKASYPSAYDAAPDRRVHRNSAPVINPRAVSPDPRRPSRKSVSPRPESEYEERRQSQQPFSPDSFDAFNPHASSSSGMIQEGARYNTPEQAREASVQHQRDIKRGEGPIIGNDGRIIDPSDHLPTDTWAPEPEPKMPKKGPEVTLRFRNSPQGAQPMPRAPRRPLSEARPNATPTPIYAHSADTSPASANRARLQKRTAATTAHPNSSPAVPTLNTTMPRHAMPRVATSDYPLQDRENHVYSDRSSNYGNGSPTYASRSSGPPPLPGKIPIERSQDFGASALSEEMRQIDIGVGGGGHRARPRRFGF